MTILLRISFKRPNVGQALWLDTLIDAGIARKWTANIGQRPARLPIAHLLVETAARFSFAGFLVDDQYELPLTQASLARALGLSLIHLNKSLASLKREGLLTVKGRSVTIHDRRALLSLTGFSDNYFHLDFDRINYLA